MSDNPNPIGRPTKWRDEFCQDVLDYMGQGYSLTAWAGKVGISRETAYAWEDSNPAFSDAVKTARAMRVNHLEGGLMDGTFAGPQITARIFALKNACPAEWREKIEHTGPDGGPLKVQVVRFGALPDLAKS